MKLAGELDDHWLAIMESNLPLINTPNTISMKLKGIYGIPEGMNKIYYFLFILIYIYLVLFHY